MTPPPDQPPVGGADEERRYQSIRAVVPAAPEAAALLLDALADDSWRVRHAAAERLAEADPTRTVPLLVAALGADSTPGRRNAAAIALAQIGPAAVPALVAALESSLRHFRTAAIEVLGEIGDQRAVADVARMLVDRDVNARIAAAEALGKLGGGASIAALHRALEVLDDPPSARAVLDALARLQAPAHIERLRRLARDPELLRPALRLAGFADDPAAFDLLASGLSALSRSAREASLQGLGQQRLRGRIPAGPAASAIQAAIPGVAALAASVAVSAEDPAQQAGALTVLQLARVPADVHAIAAAAVDDRVRPIVAEVLDALGPGFTDALLEARASLAPVSEVVILAALARWGDPRAVPLLVTALDADEPVARGLAIDVLGRYGDVQAVPSLFALLTGDDRIASARALGALLALAGRDAALRARVLGAARQQAALDVAVIRLLALLGEEDDLPLLRAGLRSPHRGIRAAAAHAIGTMALPDVVRASALPELLDATGDEDASVRASSARALGLLGRGRDHSALPRAAEVKHALARGLRDPDPAARAAAALGLADCGAVELAPAIAALARDPEVPAVAAAAALQSLRRMGKVDADLLAAAAAHPDPEVVKEVVLAAASLADAESMRLLVAGAAHSRWDVRRAAVAALAHRRDTAAPEVLRKLAQSERDPLVLEAMDAALRLREARA